MGLFALLVICLALCASLVVAVDRSKFRFCADTGFCKRNRRAGNENIIGKTFTVDKTSIQVNGAGLTASVCAAADCYLRLNVNFLKNGVTRVTVSEREPRWKPSEILMESALAAGDFKELQAGDALIPAALASVDSSSYRAFSASKSSVVVIHLNPLKVEMYQDGVLQVVANERSFMHFEPKQSNGERRLTEEVQELSDEERHQGKEVVDYGEDGLAIYADGTKEERRALSVKSNSDGDWTESFGGHRDSMPHGPISVGIDFAFPFAQHVYGIPEHTTPLSLPTTATGSAGHQAKYSQPYRLYNLDVFEYELDETMALYGHIPVMFAHGLVNGKPKSSGIFWFNPSETFIDVADGGSNMAPYKQTQWISESGEIDFFMFAGPSISDVVSQYSTLTGHQQLPPMFSLGYHQCRWNYRDEKDVANVEGMFEQLDYPVDVIWLDIEHTNGKRYFTWDKSVFPNPLEMQQNISNHGRKMVTIVDPHIKRDNGYHIHREATEKGLYIKNSHGSDYNGWCWPGDSSYLDFTNPRVREWWAQQFSLDKYEGSTLDLFTWNDMNEPSVFNGPEVSMPKDAKNLEGIEHREWHNLYGLYMQRATSEGLVQRCKDLTPERKQRPFVLSRAFWAGSQKYGAIWTGDNAAKWSHLKIASPMLLSINMAGLSFAGADVGGFFGDADAELFTRWYQAGSFTPFFRGHAHHDSKRREPWVYGEPYTSILRSVAMIRYSLLPYWYSTFYTAYVKGIPVMRPLLLEFPSDMETFAIDDEWMVGDSLLVKPITDPGKTSTEVYFPGDQPWYDFYTLQQKANSKTSVENAPLEKIPVFIRGGKIIPKKLRLRRSSKLMYFDPFTLVVAPDSNGVASGHLYMDDEFTVAHEKINEFALREFVFEGNTLTSKPLSWTEDQQNFNAVNMLERVEIANIASNPKRVVLRTKDGEKTLSYFHDASRKTLTIKKPEVRVMDTWSITIEN